MNILKYPLKYRNVFILSTVAVVFVMVILPASYLSNYSNVTVKYVSNTTLMFQSYGNAASRLTLAKNKSSVKHFNSSSLTEFVNLDDSYFGSWRLIKDGLQIQNLTGFQGISIAIGMGITSKKGTHSKKDVKFDKPPKFMFFIIFMPSFCKTASKGFKYRFFLAFDNNDQYFQHKTNLESFKKHFNIFVKKHCMVSSTYELYFIETIHSGKPARAQNDAMMAAYMLDHDYYYRVNDDTRFRSPNWSNKFIDTLKKYNPPNVGVVGPHHFGGNPSILTYDFVHKTHVDIHGFYYPRPFTDWYADNWITEVYKPNRTIKLKDIQLDHTGSGSRYKYNGSTARYLRSTTNEGKRNIEKFIRYTRKNQGKNLEKGKAIVLFLNDANGNSLYGTLKNVQLAKLFFPQWKLVLYRLDNIAIPKVFLWRLKTMDVETRSMQIKKEISKLPIYLLKYLILDDIKDNNYFMLWNVSNILTEDYVTQTEIWLKEGLPVYCVNKNSSTSTSLSFIGGKNPEFFKMIKTDSIMSALKDKVHSEKLDFDENRFLSGEMFSNFKPQKDCYH